MASQNREQKYKRGRTSQEYQEIFKEQRTSREEFNYREDGVAEATLSSHNRSDDKKKTTKFSGVEKKSSTYFEIQEAVKNKGAIQESIVNMSGINRQEKLSSIIPTSLQEQIEVPAISVTWSKFQKHILKSTKGVSVLQSEDLGKRLGVKGLGNSDAEAMGCQRKSSDGKETKKEKQLNYGKFLEVRNQLGIFQDRRKAHVGTPRIKNTVVRYEISEIERGKVITSPAKQQIKGMSATVAATSKIRKEDIHNGISSNVNSKVSIVSATPERFSQNEAFIKNIKVETDKKKKLKVKGTDVSAGFGFSNVSANRDNRIKDNIQTKSGGKYTLPAKTSIHESLKTKSKGYEEILSTSFQEERNIMSPLNEKGDEKTTAVSIREIMESSRVPNNKVPKGIEVPQVQETKGEKSFCAIKTENGERNRMGVAPGNKMISKYSSSMNTEVSQDEVGGFQLGKKIGKSGAKSDSKIASKLLSKTQKGVRSTNHAGQMYFKNLQQFEQIKNANDAIQKPIDLVQGGFLQIGKGLILKIVVALGSGLGSVFSMLLPVLIVVIYVCLIVNFLFGDEDISASKYLQALYQAYNAEMTVQETAGIHTEIQFLDWDLGTNEEVTTDIPSSAGLSQENMKDILLHYTALVYDPDKFDPSKVITVENDSERKVKEAKDQMNILDGLMNVYNYWSKSVYENRSSFINSPDAVKVNEGDTLVYPDSSEPYKFRVNVVNIDKENAAFDKNKHDPGTIAFDGSLPIVDAVTDYSGQSDVEGYIGRGVYSPGKIAVNSVSLISADDNSISVDCEVGKGFHQAHYMTDAATNIEKATSVLDRFFPVHYTLFGNMENDHGEYKEINLDEGRYQIELYADNDSYATLASLYQDKQCYLTVLDINEELTAKYNNEDTYLYTPYYSYEQKTYDYIMGMDSGTGYVFQEYERETGLDLNLDEEQLVFYEKLKKFLEQSEAVSGAEDGNYVVYDGNIGESVVALAKTKIGCKYDQKNRMGTNPDVYDCSSFAYRMYKEVAGVTFGNESYAPVAAELAKWCDEKHYNISQKDLKPGDLIFTSTSTNGRYKNITHVAIYIDDTHIISAKGAAYGVCEEAFSAKNIVVCARPYTSNEQQGEANNPAISDEKAKEINKLVKQAVKKGKNLDLGTFNETAYCPCKDCSGDHGRSTKSGRKAKSDHTIAADLAVLPMGTRVRINGKTYTVEDVGGAVGGLTIDIFHDRHGQAEKWGRTYYKVTVVGCDKDLWNQWNKKDQIE